MFKKICILFLCIMTIFALVGCSTQDVDSTSTFLLNFTIVEGGQIDAAIDKAHIVYGIYVHVDNPSDIEEPFDVANLSCFASEGMCELYSSEIELTIIAPGEFIEGWIYYKVPAVHGELSYTYTYNENGDYITLDSSEG